VREAESPWTKSELRAVRQQLIDEVARLQGELVVADDQLAELIRDSADAVGDDQADTGSKAFEREHGINIANNARDLVQQNLVALRRIDDASYGICTSCGKPVGKARLLAFPRATLCMECKQREERR
jgi:DnaK suppressor protein